MKAAICLNVNLYLEKNEEEFAPYLRDFATAIWGQLMQARPAHGTARALLLTLLHFAGGPGAEQGCAGYRVHPLPHHACQRRALHTVPGTLLEALEGAPL